MTDTLNRGRLLATMSYIEEHPEKWDQGTWAKANPGKDATGWKPDDACGTAFCFAGRTAVDAGYVPYYRPFQIQEINSGETNEVHTNEFISADVYKNLKKKFKKTGAWEKAEYAQTQTARFLAQELLGLDNWSADQLFGGSNSLTTLRNMVAYLLIHGNLDDYNR